MTDHPAPRTRSARRRGRALVGVAAMAAGAAVIAACGPPPSLSTGKNNTSQVNSKTLPPCPIKALEKAKGKVKVTLWYGGLGGSNLATLERQVKLFNQSQSKIQLVASNQGSDYNEVLRKYKAAASNPSQLPGVIYLEDTALGVMVDRGQVLPAESCMHDDGYDVKKINAAVRGSYSVRDVLWPGYINVSAPILYYNKVHFKKAGLDVNKPPKTLDELYRVAKTLKEKGVSQKPMVLKLDEWFFETWLSGVGVDSVNKDNGQAGVATKATFDTPQMRKLIAFFKKMQKEGLLNVFPDTPGSIDHYLALVTQQSSMLVETSTAATTIRDALGGNIDPAEAGVDVPAGLLDSNSVLPGAGELPGIEAPGKVHPSGGAFYILNTDSPAQQAASWRFLKFMLRPEGVTDWYLNGGYQPIVKGVTDSPKIQEFWDHDLAGNMLKQAYDELSTADPDQTRPLLGPYQEYSNIFQGGLESIFLRGEDPDKALKNTQDAATKLLTDYAGG